jgi:hypothetical protein
MKIVYWLLLFFSAVLYFLPFLFSDFLWWLIFLFPIPFLYVTSKHNLSFLHGYIWGLFVFALHGSGGIYSITRMAQEAWVIGIVLGISMVLYQAMYLGLIFYAATTIIHRWKVEGFLYRLLMWTVALLVFIIWTDNYSFWIFGVLEGYPLMHPLLPLAQHPALLTLMPLIGEHALTILFLLFSFSVVVFTRYKNYTALFFVGCASMPWLLSLWCASASEAPAWYACTKSLPCMVHCNGDDPTVPFKVVAHQLRKIITQFPATEMIIMPESAFNLSNFEQLSSSLQLWNEFHLGKPIHILFGAGRQEGGNCYNALHWVYDGVLQGYHDKQHTMLISERLVWWMDNDVLRRIYRKDGITITRSDNDVIAMKLAQDILFVPYICSELFFNEKPHDEYAYMPIIAIVNDMWFLNTYIQNLLLLLARTKAISWQHDIAYVSYTQSVFIDIQGVLREMDTVVPL